MKSGPRSLEFLSVASIFVTSSFFYLLRLGRGALVDWDEAIHAEVSKQIVVRHQWLTLFWQQEPYFRKPPLSFWIRAVAFHVFGITEFSARLESACAGIAILFLVYAIGRRHSLSAALTSACVLLTTRKFDITVRQGTTDALLCLFIFLALFAYTRRPGGNAFAFYMICAAIGAGMMVKGPAMWIAPLTIILDLFFHREQTSERRRLRWALAAVLATALAWSSVKISRFAGQPLANEMARLAKASKHASDDRLFVVVHPGSSWTFQLRCSTGPARYID